MKPDAKETVPNIIDTDNIGDGSVNERRRDQTTRIAIEEIQELLFDPDASDKIFSLLLGYMIDITNCDYGVCFVSSTNAEFPIEPGANLLPITHQDSPAFIDEKVLSSWVGEKNLLTSIVYYNSPIPTGTQAILRKEHEVSSIMILPISMHSQLRGICILGNKKDSFSPKVLGKVKTIIGAVICTLQTAETVRGNFSGLDQQIADNRYLSSLISSSPIGVIVVNADATILLSNPAAQDIFDEQAIDLENHESLTLAGNNIHQFFPNYEAFFQWSNQHGKMGDNEDTHSPRLWKQVLAHRKDGSSCIVNLTVFRYTHGAQRFTTLQIQDITTIQKSSEEYKRTSQQLNALTQLAPVGIIHVTAEWNCIFSNEKWTEFSGLSREESTEHNWINAIHPKDVSALLESLRNSLQEGVDHYSEVRLISPLGTTKWIDFSIRILFDTDGEIEGFLGTCNDITERYINQEKLRHIAEYDSLTGLANRMLFQDRLQQAFRDSDRDHSIVSIFFLDLDGFKDINDTLGHDVGDMLLQKVSDRLINILRKNDTVARFGGDEFVVMLGHDDHLAEVVIVAEKVIDSIAKPYELDGHEVFITTSLGIAQGDAKDSSPETILKNADVALYSAKKEGKNKYQLFNQEIEEGSKSRIQLLNDLRTGLARDVFTLHFQAICDALSNEILGFEALLRFTDKEGALIPPDRFIPLLEEYNMIVDVGQWVIEETCRQLSEWQKTDEFPENGYITFNVSAKQMLGNDLVKYIESACQTHKVDPSFLVMEITESVIINQTKHIINTLNTIRDLGVRLALDDFGTGYSSLSYLQKFPFNILKIDKSFVDDLTENSSDIKIFKAIIALANSFELKVVAEGVETEFARQMIVDLGANSYQGYFLSKPIPAEQVIPLIESHKSK